ncbi:MAG TPA: hypothetical protein VD816_07655 [Ohtaekwangia sp.]|nr:hypothetical protein [Ohtaekwangia sp.]
MILFRFLLLVFNVAVVSFLIYKMLEVVRQPVSRSKKTIVIAGGVILLLAPFGMFLRFFVPTFQYFLIYPIAIALFLYLTREL